MTRLPFLLPGSLMLASPLAAADRPTDRDVKALVSRIEQGRDRFDDALDDRLKHSIIRGPNGEVNVSRFLDDFEENIDRLEERLKPDYSASAEAATLLRQASSIDRYFRQQPPGTKGASEWNRLAADLNALANAYGTDFPLPEGATVRRVGDRELAASVDEIARSAGRLERALDNDLKKDTSVEKGERTAIVREADLLEKDAKALRSRIKDGKPSSTEADALLERAARLRAFIEDRQVANATRAWVELARNVQKVADAYGRPVANAAR